MKRNVLPMKAKRFAVLLFLGVALQVSSCGKNEPSQASSSATPSSQTSQETAQVAESSGGLTAEPWNGKLNELLTMEMAVKVTGYVASEGKEKYNQVLKSPETHSVKYSWKKGRESTIQNPVTNSEMTVPVDDSVELSWVRDTTLEKFKANYHTPTEEELAQADAAMNNKLGEMESEGRVTADQSQMAKGMASSMAEGLSFDDVSGVGDYAVWNNKDKELKVFVKGMEFQVRVDVGSDEAVNRQKSVEVAQMIIGEKLAK